jgi:hypothetical protein
MIDRLGSYLISKTLFRLKNLSRRKRCPKRLYKQQSKWATCVFITLVSSSSSSSLLSSSLYTIVFMGIFSVVNVSSLLYFLEFLTLLLIICPKTLPVPLSTSRYDAFVLFSVRR